MLGAKAGYCSCPLKLTPPEGWAKHLSHPSGPTPGHTPTLIPYKKQTHPSPREQVSKETSCLFSLLPAKVRSPIKFCLAKKKKKEFYRAIFQEVQLLYCSPSYSLSFLSEMALANLELCIVSSICQFSLQFSSVAQPSPSPCGPMDCSMPGFPVHYQLPELAQTHVH